MLNQIKGILLAGLLLAFSASAFAQTPELTNLSEISSSSTDYGQGLLNFVTFGQFEEPSDGEHVSLVSAISRFINIVALYMMAALSVFGGLNYILHTANKGVPGGQVISSFWMPLRISISTILLIPLASGFSTIQIKGVYNIASTGNAHGSYLATLASDHLITNGAYMAPALVSNVNVINGLIASELCRIRVNSAERDENSVTPVYRIIGDRATLSYDKAVKPLIGRDSTMIGYCGTVEVNLPRPSGYVVGLNETENGATVDEGAWQNGLFLTYKDRADLLLGTKFKEIIEDWRVKAQEIASNLAFDESALADMQDNNQTSVFKSHQANTSKMVGIAANKALALYSTADKRLQTEISQIVASTRGSNTPSGKPQWKVELDRLGWTYSGMIFWQSTKNTELTNLIASGLSYTYLEAKDDGQFANDERAEDLATRLKDMNQAISDKGYIPPNSSSVHYVDIGGISEAGGSGTGVFKRWMGSLVQGFGSSFVVDDQTDMVSQLQTTGNTVGSILDITVHATIIGEALAEGGYTFVQTAAQGAMTTAANSFAGIAGTFFGPAATAISSAALGAAKVALVIFQGYTGLIKGVIGPALIACFLLAIVLPALPLFYWIMGIVSWILFYVECLLISPIWLAAHGTAEKEGWGTDHTRQGYMLMIGLYLNPILRTAGFFTILVILFPLGTLVRWFGSYLSGVISTGMITSPLMVVGSMLLLAFLGYTIVNRVFSLPNELFEKGLRWVNGGQEVTGDESSATKINAMIGNFGYKAEGAFREGTGRKPDKPTGQPTDPAHQGKN